MFFITEFSLSLTARFAHNRVVYKKFQRNNFITRALRFSIPPSPHPLPIPNSRVLRSTFPLPNGIQFQTEQPYLRRTNHCALVCARYTPGVHRWFLIYTRISRVWGTATATGKREREGVGGGGAGARGGGRVRTGSGFDFQPTIRYCQLFSVHVGPIVNLSRDGGRLLHPKWSRYVNLHNASIK